MTLQTWIVLALACASAIYCFRGSFKSALGGGCASGCGSCKSGGCPVNKLQAVQKELEARH